MFSAFQGSLSELQFLGTLYIGGYKDRYDVPSASGINENFTGIIQRVNRLWNALHNEDIHSLLAFVNSNYNYKKINDNRLTCKLF